VAKIRYSDTGSRARVVDSDEQSFLIEFLEPKTAITPGQSVVLYNDEGVLLAGGIITKQMQGKQE
jgi:tRNA-specific 2-thiouridylase